jgi:hypothetical protein
MADKHQPTNDNNGNDNDNTDNDVLAQLQQRLLQCEQVTLRSRPIGIAQQSSSGINRRSISFSGALSELQPPTSTSTSSSSSSSLSPSSPSFRAGEFRKSSLSFEEGDAAIYDETTGTRRSRARILSAYRSSSSSASTASHHDSANNSRHDSSSNASSSSASPLSSPPHLSIALTDDGASLWNRDPRDHARHRSRSKSAHLRHLHHRSVLFASRDGANITSTSSPSEIGSHMLDDESAAIPPLFMEEIDVDSSDGEDDNEPHLDATLAQHDSAPHHSCDEAHGGITFTTTCTSEITEHRSQQHGIHDDDDDDEDVRPSYLSDDVPRRNWQNHSPTTQRRPTIAAMPAQKREFNLYDKLPGGMTMSWKNHTEIQELEQETLQRLIDIESKYSSFLFVLIREYLQSFERSKLDSAATEVVTFLASTIEIMYSINQDFMRNLRLAIDKLEKPLMIGSLLINVVCCSHRDSFADRSVAG